MADDSARLLSSKWVRVDLPPPAVAPASDDLVTHAVELARPLDSAELAYRKAVVRGTCEGLDASEALGGNEEDVFTYVAMRVPSAYADRLAVEDLIDNLSSARTSPDFAMVLGRALLCEWASS
jgi:hypothetical protein